MSDIGKQSEDLKPCSNSAGQLCRISRRQLVVGVISGVCLSACRADGAAEQVEYPSKRILNLGAMSKLAEGVSVFSLQRVLLVRATSGIRAVSMICTHQSCLLVPSTDKGSGEFMGFECPCHGARFGDRGEVTRGPAQRALQWFRLSMNQSGELLVDLSDAVSADWRFVPPQIVSPTTL